MGVWELPAIYSGLQIASVDFIVVWRHLFPEDALPPRDISDFGSLREVQGEDFGENLGVATDVRRAYNIRGRFAPLGRGACRSFPVDKRIVPVDYSRLSSHRKYPPEVQKILLSTLEDISYPLPQDWTEDLFSLLKDPELGKPLT
jgi:hypothetical protein